MKQLLLVMSVVAWVASTTIVWWLATPVFSPAVILLIGSVSSGLVFLLLVLRFYLAKSSWLKVWRWASPPFVSSVAVFVVSAGHIPTISLITLLAGLLVTW